MYAYNMYYVWMMHTYILLCVMYNILYLSFIGNSVLGSTSTNGDDKFCAARFKKRTTMSKFYIEYKNSISCDQKL